MTSVAIAPPSAASAGSCRLGPSLIFRFCGNEAKFNAENFPQNCKNHSKKPMVPGAGLEPARLAAGIGWRLSRRLRLRLEAISVIVKLSSDFLANLDQAPRRLFFVG